MQIKRTVAPTVRQAMNKVRKEQGPDAVILANRKIEGGVEIISATDYDESAFESISTPVANPRANTALIEGADDSNDIDSSTNLSYQSIARSQAQKLQTDSVQPATSPLTNSVDLVALTKARKPVSAEHKNPPSPVSDQDIARQEVKTVVPEPTDHKDNIVDISAVPGTRPPAMHDSSEAADNAWQREQIIHDVQRELHQLRGLMQNQLSVLEWESLAKRDPVQFDLLSRFSEIGLGADIVRALVDDSMVAADPEKAWRAALGRLASKIPIADDDQLENSGIVALVGPTGVGKTTSVAKLAARYVMRHGQQSVGLISTDGYRIGAHKQLHNFAGILGVSFKTANNRGELSTALGSFFDKKLVLIDTAGMSQRDIRLSEQFLTLRESFPVIRCCLVLAANTQLGALDESARGFGRAGLSSCIVTKLDESTSIGAAITVAIRHQLPIAYVGVGQRVPEDLQPARAHRLVSRAVPMAERYGERIEPYALATRFGSRVKHAHV
jgi:flagellar biosynthesis protein FlhF